MREAASLFGRSLRLTGRRFYDSFFRRGPLSASQGGGQFTRKTYPLILLKNTLGYYKIK